jgi:formate dehydrogenase subunit gamma
METQADPHDAAVAVCERYHRAPAALIEILHDLQAALGFIPDEVLPTIARELNIARAEVHGVRSFYHDFRSAPPPAITVKVCRAEACQSMGAEQSMTRLCGELGIKVGDTSPGGIEVHPVYCLGNCALAPAAMVNGRLVGQAGPERLLALVEGMKQ